MFLTDSDYTLSKLQVGFCDSCLAVLEISVGGVQSSPVTCLECPRGRMALCKERKERKNCAAPNIVHIRDCKHSLAFGLIFHNKKCSESE